MASESDRKAAADVLKVPRDASKEDIEKAFRKRSRESHPDLHPNRPGWASREQTKLNSAKDTLLKGDPFKAKLCEDTSQNSFTAFFNSGKRRKTTPLTKLPPTEHNLNVSLEDLVACRTVSFTVKCGEAPPERIDVKLRPGWTTGSKDTHIDRIKKPGYLPGDLIVIIHELPHDTFNRVGDDLRVTTRVPLEAALVGSCIGIDMIDKSIHTMDLKGSVLDVDMVYCVKGHGLPRAKIGGRGDCFVSFKVMLPPQLTEEQRKLIRAAKLDNWFH